MPYLATALVAFLTAVILTPLVRRVAVRFQVLDQPGEPRKRHRSPVPLLGGLAVLGGLVAATIVAVWQGWLPGASIQLKHLWGLGIAALLLAVGGALDDRFDLKPRQQIVWPVVAALVVVASGIGIEFITNPFGGQFELNTYRWTVLWWGGVPYHLTLLADLFSVAWIMGMTYTTKFLDGLDGLVAGVAIIGGLVIAAVSQLADVSQPDTAVLALAVAGAFAGFLVFNFPPARIFLGEGGATLAGFVLAALAIVAGGKIATALLIMGLPIFDTAVVIVRRWQRGQPVWRGDRSHLHFRLLEYGLTPRQAILCYWAAAVAFGTATLLLDGAGKLLALAVIATVLALVLLGAPFKKSADR